MLSYTSVVSVYISLSIPLNLWMVIQCLRMSDHHVKHILLASFAAGNLLHSILGQGLQIATSEGASDDKLCSWAQFSSWFTAVGSMIHFASLSFEQSLLSTNSSMLDLLLQKRFYLPPILWVYSLLWAAVPLLGWSDYLKFGIFYPGCQVDETEDLKAGDLLYLLLLVFFGVIVPLGVAMICQMRSYRSQSLCSITSIISLAYGDKKLYKRQKQLQQLNLTCVCMLGVWFLVWLPYLSCVLYFVIIRKKLVLFTEVAPLIRELCVLLPPLVYSYWYVKYHTSLPRWITKKRDKSTKTNTDVDTTTTDQGNKLMGSKNETRL